MHSHSLFSQWVVRGFRVAAGLLLVFASLPSRAQLIFYPGDELRISPDTGFFDLSFLGGGTSKYTYQAGFYTDFTFQDMMTGAYLGVNAWSERFPNFDYVISALNPDGDGVFPMRQENGDLVFQEMTGNPSYLHLTTYDPVNGFEKILSVEFPQDTKRVTLLKGMAGGFLVDETVGDVTRLGMFDRMGELVTELVAENHRFVATPNVGVFPNGSLVISGVTQTADAGGQEQGTITKIDQPQPGAPNSRRSALFARRFLANWESVKDEAAIAERGLIPFLISLQLSLSPASEGASKKTAKNSGPTTKAASGLAVGWVDTDLTTTRELDFPELSENDSYRKLRVAAGRGNEIVIPARMDDPSGGASFLVLIRLDLDTGNVLETVRFKLDEELTMTAIEYRSGRLFAQLRGLAQNYLLKCDPLNLADLAIKRVASVSSRVQFNLPDDITQPLNFTWPDTGTPAHFVAAFDDTLDDTLGLDFEAVTPVVLESFTTAVTDQGANAGTPATVFVEQTDPLWADLLQPNTRPLTITQANLNLTQTYNALRLTGEPDGTGKLQVRFPTVTGYEYQLRSAGNPMDMSLPGSIVETIAGTGGEVVRSFEQTSPEQFFVVTAAPAP